MPWHRPVPDGIVPLIGYREWSIRREPGGRHPRLLSLFHPTTWPYDRPFSAVCLRPISWPERSTRPFHDGVPDESCQCGIYAFRRPEFESLNGAGGPKVRGIVFGWGRYVLGTLGWRTQFARLVALLARDEDPELVNDLANRYRVEVVPHLDRIRFLPGLPAT
jgi:hypothetical protein